MRLRVRVLGLELLAVELSDGGADNGCDPGDSTSQLTVPRLIGFSRWQPAPGDDEL